MLIQLKDPDTRKRIETGKTEEPIIAYAAYRARTYKTIAGTIAAEIVSDLHPCAYLHISAHAHPYMRAHSRPRCTSELREALLPCACTSGLRKDPRTASESVRPDSASPCVRSAQRSLLHRSPESLSVVFAERSRCGQTVNESTRIRRVHFPKVIALNASRRWVCAPCHPVRGSFEDRPRRASRSTTSKMCSRIACWVVNARCELVTNVGLR